MTPARALRLTVRVVHLNLGLALFGLGIALQVNAGIGLGPWDAFHQGISVRTPLTYGQASVLAGLAVLLLSMAMARVRPGVGTLLNMLLIGPWVDVFRAWPRFPVASGFVDGAAWFLLGLVLTGLATGLYLTAGLGAGPRDGFALALAKRLGITVRRARTLVEVVVLTSGWLLGGTVGVGTLAFALGIGPLMQWSLRLFAGLGRGYERWARGEACRASPGHTA